MGNQVAACLLLALAASGACRGEEPRDDPPAAGASAAATSDSEGLHSQRLGALGYLRYVREGDADAIGVDAGRYSQGDWQRRFGALTYRHADLDRATGIGLRLSTALSHQGERTLATADVEWSHEVHPGTRLAFIYARDWVETARALDDGVHFDMPGVSLDQRIGDHLTAVAFLARQEFSDGNSRNHGRARLIYSPWPETGLTFQLRYRRYRSSRTDVEGRYFNPQSYSETLVVLALRRRFEAGWIVAAEAGAGRQRVADDPSAPANLAAFTVTRILGDRAQVRGYASYHRSASFGGPDYRWREIGVEGVMPF
jgi:hypothetical protein